MFPFGRGKELSVCHAGLHKRIGLDHLDLKSLVLTLHFYTLRPLNAALTVLAEVSKNHPFKALKNEALRYALCDSCIARGFPEESPPHLTHSLKTPQRQLYEGLYRGLL